MKKVYAYVNKEVDPVAENKGASMEQKKVSLSEKLWLAYFNSYLYEKGVITESERNRMVSKIQERKGSAYEKGR